MFIICLIKSQDSFNKIKDTLNNIDVEEYINSLEYLQQRISIHAYDLAVIDIKLWWRDEAIKLFKRNNINYIDFAGNFEETIKNINNFYEKNKAIDDKKQQSKQEVVKNVKPEIKYVYREKVVEVPKIVIKSKNIRQQIYSITSLTDENIRDNFSINVGYVFSRKSDTSTLIIDLSKFELINHVDSVINKPDKIFDNSSSLNPNSLNDYLYKIENNFCLLKVDNTILTEEIVKTILFAARDYENIIFVLNAENDNSTFKFIYTLSNFIFLLTDALLISRLNNLKFIDKIIENGQSRENIKIIITELADLESNEIDYMYKPFKTFYINRNLYINSINKRKIVALNNDTEMNTYFELLHIDHKTKKFNIFELFKKGGSNL